MWVITVQTWSMQILSVHGPFATNKEAADWARKSLDEDTIIWTAWEINK